MSQWKPCKRRDFIHRLKIIGFTGPYSGAKHQFMVYGQHRLAVPSNAEYSASQLGIMIKETESIIKRPISTAYWEHLKSA